MPYEDGRVKKEDWDEFVKYVTSEEFKQKSEKGKENKSKDEYPHYMGRTPYAQNELIGWKEEGLYDSSAYSSTSTVSSLSARTLNWMRARKKKDDKGNLIVPHEKTRQAIENIEEWERKAKSGEFQPYRTDDVLNRALNRNEHNGRALGYGGKSTIRDVFGSSHRSSSYRAAKEINDDLKLKALVKEQVAEQVALALAAYGLEKTNQEPGVDAMPVDDQIVDMPPPKSSVQSGGVDPFVDLQEITKCRLAVLIEGEKVIVAYGCVYPTMATTHHKKIPPDNVAVNIDGIEKGYEAVEVPVPNDHIAVLGDAVGSFTQWPKNMIVLDVKQAINPTGQRGKKKKQIGNATNESVALPRKPFQHSKNALAPQMSQKLKKKNTSGNVATNESVGPVRKPPHELSQKCKMLKSMLQGFDENASFSINFAKDVFCLSEGHAILLTKEDVNQLLSGAWLSTSVIEVFIVAMGSEHTHLFESIAFMLPTSISSVSLDSEQRKDESSRYMTHVIKANSSKRFIMCPYFEEYHWSLFVLCPAKREVYSIDSRIGTEVKNTTFRTFLNRAFMTHILLEPKRTDRSELKWIAVKCPQQPGDSECGYYTMCNMLKLVLHHLESENLAQDFARTTPYTQEELQSMLDMWAKYFSVLMHWRSLLEVLHQTPFK